MAVYYRAMAPVVARHGHETVWRVALTTVGYPATWVHDSKAAAAIEAEIQREIEMVRVNFREAQGSQENVKAGRYHVEIVGAAPTDDGDSVAVTYQILSGTTPGGEGRTTREWLKLSGKAARQTMRLLETIGIVDSTALADEEDIDFDEALGSRLVIELREETYQGKTRVRVAWGGYYRCDDPAVRDVPAPGVAATATQWATEDDL